MLLRTDSEILQVPHCISFCIWKTFSLVHFLQIAMLGSSGNMFFAFGLTKWNYLISLVSTGLNCKCSYMSSIFCLSLVWSNLFLIENFTFFFLSLRKIAEVVKFCKPRVPPSLSQGYMLLSGKVRNSSNFSSSLFASALPAPQRSNWPCFSELGCVVTSYPCWSVSSLGCCFSQGVMHEVA